MTKNVIAYISDFIFKQDKRNKYSLEKQKEKIINYCEKYELNILKWYSDECNARVEERSGLEEIVYENNNPPYEAVIVAYSDIIDRDINIYFYYKCALLKKDIELISVCKGFHKSRKYVHILNDFISTSAEMDRIAIRKRTMSAREVKSSNGGYSGGRPAYGYTSVGGKLVVVPEEAEIVREVFNLKNDGLTYRAIAEIFKDKGYKTRKDKDFAASTIQVIYNNQKLYLGYYKYGDNDWVLGVHESILWLKRLYYLLYGRFTSFSDLFTWWWKAVLCLCVFL